MSNRIPLALLLGLLAPGPIAAQIAVLGSTVQEHTGRPGESYTGTILVRNTTSEAQTARIYQTDYRFAADGSSEFDAPGTANRSNAKWVATTGSQVTVPGGATVPIHFAVNIPGDSALDGSYWSMIMVEGVKAANRTPSTRQPSMGVVPVLRYGVQVVSHIEQSGARKVEFLNTRVVSEPGGRRTLEFEIHNTGERAFRLDVKAELFEGAGSSVGTFQQTRGLIYPGSSVLQRFDISSLPAQEYQALILADTGEDDVFGAQYTLRM